MKIQYCSDLHLEFKENINFLKQYPIEPVAEILLLAGDILPFSAHNQPNEFLDFIADNFETVYWIPGNHEYYGFDIADLKVPLHEKIRENVILLNNQTIIYKNAELICATLWSHIRPQNEWIIQKSVSDFEWIKNNGKKLTPHDFNALHENDLMLLKSAISTETERKRIVITHHVPTLQHYPAQYRNSNINEAFAVELYDFIEKSNVSYWIYGHHHINTPAFTIGNTTMLTNQLGYVKQGEHVAFQNNAIIEL